MNSAPFDWTELLESARRTALNAHSPFSKFRVGAAVVDAGGVVYNGCNIESASYGLTICAERVAIFCAMSAGAGKLTRLAVACLDAPGGQATLRMPCGACRQVMSELLEPNAEILIDGVGVMKIDQLLPNAFRLAGR